MLNGRRSFVWANCNSYPVAGHRMHPGFCLMSEPSRKLGGHIAELHCEHIEIALLYDHARGHQPAGDVRLKLLLERLAPAVAVEHDGCPSVGKP